MKEENFIKKVKEMIVEEEKKRIPIAQGLTWTTDELGVNLLFLALLKVVLDSHQDKLYSVSTKCSLHFL